MAPETKQVIRGWARQSGQVSVLLVGGLLCGLLALGLAFDGTRLLIARRDVASVADAAALAGAGEVDEDTYRTSDGRIVQLDRDAAAVEAQAAAGRDHIDIDAQADHIAVRVRRDVPLVLLRFMGLQRVGASAVGTPKVP